MEKNQKRKMENELQKLLAIEFVKNYCQQNAISLNRLNQQRFELSYGECGFFQPSEIEPNGLLNDKETIPRLTLSIRNDEGTLIIEETEFTEQYLRK